MTHDELINRMRKLATKIDSQARAAKDLARRERCVLSEAARELSWLLTELDLINHHCERVRSAAVQRLALGIPAQVEDLHHY